MKTTGYIFWVILFYGCGSNESKKTPNNSNIDTIKTVESSMKPECIQSDTTTSLGTSIHYLYRDGKFQISWGDYSYNRIYDSLFSCDYDENSGLWDFVPKFNSETKNYLVLTNIYMASSGGNPAPLEYYSIILPKNRKDTIFEKVLFIDCEGNYLVYGDIENDKIHIINIETKRSQTIKLKPEPAISRSPTLSIRKTEIKGTTIYIQYESLDKNDEEIIIEKTFKIVV